MNKEILKQVMPEALERIEAGRCPSCGKPIDDMKFKDALSEKEFEISGLCQSCQDEVFDRIGEE